MLSVLYIVVNIVTIHDADLVTVFKQHFINTK